MSAVTLLTPAGARKSADRKIWDGERFQGIVMARSFTAHTEAVPDLAELFRVLKGVTEGFAIHGTPEGPVSPGALIERNSRSINDTPQQWMCIDVDGVPRPTGEGTFDRDAARAVLATIGLPDHSALVQWTASAHTKPGYNCHVFVWLSEPMSYRGRANFTVSLAGAQGLYTSDGRRCLLDTAVCTATQPLYLVPPEFPPGMADPVAQRWHRIEGKYPVVDVSEVDQTDTRDSTAVITGPMPVGAMLELLSRRCLPGGAGGKYVQQLLYGGGGPTAEQGGRHEYGKRLLAALANILIHADADSLLSLVYELWWNRPEVNGGDEPRFASHAITVAGTGGQGSPGHQAIVDAGVLQHLAGLRPPRKGPEHLQAVLEGQLTAYKRQKLAELKPDAPGFDVDEAGLVTFLVRNAPELDLSESLRWSLINANAYTDVDAQRVVDQYTAKHVAAVVSKLEPAAKKEVKQSREGRKVKFTTDRLRKRADAIAEYAEALPWLSVQNTNAAVHRGQPPQPDDVNVRLLLETLVPRMPGIAFNPTGPDSIELYLYEGHRWRTADASEVREAIRDRADDDVKPLIAKLSELDTESAKALDELQNNTTDESAAFRNYTTSFLDTAVNTRMSNARIIQAMRLHGRRVPDEPLYMWNFDDGFHYSWTPEGVRSELQPTGPEHGARHVLKAKWRLGDDALARLCAKQEARMILRRVLDDAEAEFLIRWYASTTVGLEDGGTGSMLIQYGVGKNGKSAIQEAHTTVFEPLCGTLDQNILSGKGGHTSGIGRLSGRRLGFIDDLQYEALSLMFCKNLMSGALIAAQKDMGVRAQDVKLGINISIGTNKPPQLDDSSRGAQRRTFAVLFERNAEQFDEINYGLFHPGWMWLMFDAVGPYLASDRRSVFEQLETDKMKELKARWMGNVTADADILGDRISELFEFVADPNARVKRTDVLSALNGGQGAQARPRAVSDALNRLAEAFTAETGTQIRYNHGAGGGGPADRRHWYHLRRRDRSAEDSPGAVIAAVQNHLRAVPDLPAGE